MSKLHLKILSIPRVLTRGEFIPDYPRGDEITILHLLNHRSGIPDFVFFPDWKTTKKVPATLEKIIEGFKNKPLEFDPGQKYKYNNSGYVLLSYIIEKVSKESYEDYLRKHIFKPLDMHSSGYDRHQKLLKNRADGYAPANNEFANADYIDMTYVSGAGGLYSTIEDLYLWDRALYTDKVVKKSSIDNIVASLVSDPIKDEYSYGWVLDHYVSRPYMWHNGGVDGFRSYIARYIKDDVCIIILSNFGFTPEKRVSHGLAKIVFGEPYELPKPIIKLDPKSYDAYVGDYQFSKNVDLTIIRKNDRLFATRVPGLPALVEIFPESETEFFLKVSDASISFIKDAEGNISKLIWHQEKKDTVMEKIK